MPLSLNQAQNYAANGFEMSLPGTPSYSNPSQNPSYPSPSSHIPTQGSNQPSTTSGSNGPAVSTYLPPPPSYHSLGSACSPSVPTTAFGSYTSSYNSPPVTGPQIQHFGAAQAQQSPDTLLMEPTLVQNLTQEDNGAIALISEPIVNKAIKTQHLVNKRAPKQCYQGLLEHYPNIQLGPGQPPIFRQQLPDEKWARAITCSVTAYIAFAVCVVLLILWVPYYTNAYGYGATTVICASVFLCLSYLVAVIEGCCSKVNGFVSNVTNADDFIKKHKALLQAVPTIAMRVEASHEEARTSTSGSGKDQQTTTTYETVVTYRESNTFPFSMCIDVSGPMELFQSGIIRIESEKTFGFLNQQTADLYDQMMEAMLARARQRDTDQTFHMEFYMPKFKKRVTVYTQEDSRTQFMSPVFYGCLNCLMCSWPYRIFFWSSTQKRNYTYVKLISL